MHVRARRNPSGLRRLFQVALDLLESVRRINEALSVACLGGLDLFIVEPDDRSYGRQHIAPSVASARELAECLQFVAPCLEGRGDLSSQPSNLRERRRLGIGGTKALDGERIPALFRLEGPPFASGRGLLGERLADGRLRAAARQHHRS
jgi:hypothetical protein